MPSLKSEAMRQAQIRLLRRYARSFAAKIGGVALFDFLCLRIFAPELIDLHRDWAFIAGVVCMFAAVGAAIWLAWQVLFDLRRYQQERRELTRSLH